MTLLEDLQVDHSAESQPADWEADHFSDSPLEDSEEDHFAALPPADSVVVPVYSREADSQEVVSCLGPVRLPELKTRRKTERQIGSST